MLPETRPDPDAAKKAVAQAKAAAKKVKHERSDPNSKAGMKKETLLAITASKFDDFPEWYKQVRDHRSWFLVGKGGREQGDCRAHVAFVLCSSTVLFFLDFTVSVFLLPRFS